jgi:protein-L-isoaspartate(D-aspartate) O-methyltransferase
MRVEQAREWLAEELRVVHNLKSPALVQALREVPRERFLGPGPWLLYTEGGGGTRPTDSDDPVHVYHNTSLAIDPARQLFNGQPGLVAAWLDALGVQPGERVVHVGTGTGYYTALLAHMTGPGGHVHAVEVDGDLAARARANLRDLPWVEVHQGDGRTALPASADVVLIHAGATHVLDEWLDLLADGGRLLVPLTCAMPALGATLSKGLTLIVGREGGTWRARLTTPVAIYSLVGLRDPERDAALAAALRTGTWMSVTRLRRDAHDAAATCWLHGADGPGRICCLSR